MSEAKQKLSQEAEARRVGVYVANTDSLASLLMKVMLLGILQ